MRTTTSQLATFTWFAPSVKIAALFSASSFVCIVEGRPFVCFLVLSRICVIKSIATCYPSPDEEEPEPEPEPTAHCDFNLSSSSRHSTWVSKWVGGWDDVSVEMALRSHCLRVYVCRCVCKLRVYVQILWIINMIYFRHTTKSRGKTDPRHYLREGYRASTSEYLCYRV